MLNKTEKHLIDWLPIFGSSTTSILLDFFLTLAHIKISAKQVKIIIIGAAIAATVIHDVPVPGAVTEDAVCSASNAVNKLLGGTEAVVNFSLKKKKNKE